jgi:hypothetical protein
MTASSSLAPLPDRRIAGWRLAYHPPDGPLPGADLSPRGLTPVLVVLFPYELPQVGAQLGLATEVDGREAFGFRLGGSQPKSVGEVGNTKTSEFPPGRLADLGSLIGCGQEPQVVGGNMTTALAGWTFAVRREAGWVWAPLRSQRAAGPAAGRPDGLPGEVLQEVFV